MSWVDSCDLEYALADLKAENERLQAENDSLRKELAVNEPLFETLNAANDGLISENMKLRELVRDVAAVICVYDQCVTVDDCPPALPMFADKMRELGVDV